MYWYGMYSMHICTVCVVVCTHMYVQYVLYVCSVCTYVRTKLYVHRIKVWSAGTTRYFLCYFCLLASYIWHLCICTYFCWCECDYLNAWYCNLDDTAAVNGPLIVHCLWTLIATDVADLHYTVFTLLPYFTLLYFSSSLVSHILLILLPDWRFSNN